MNIEEMVAGKGNKPQGIISGRQSLVEDIQNSLAEMEVAQENAAEAKAELDRLIGEKLHDGVDPFVAMMNAMLYVVPQLMKYKEEKLVEKTVAFEYINSLNAYMAETQKNFAISADAGETSDKTNGYGMYQEGNTSYVDENGMVHGLAAGRGYEANLKILSAGDLLSGLPGDIQDVMNDAMSTILGLKTSTPDAGDWVKGDSQYGKVAKTEYNLSETLWGGLNTPKWRMGEGTEAQFDNNMYDPMNGQGLANFDYFNQDSDPAGNSTESSYLASELLPVVDQAVTQNAVMTSTLNGYSKKVESEFKFEMENYNTIVSLNGLMYQDQLNLNNTHITRLRAR